jgi:hypothetical protein
MCQVGRSSSGQPTKLHAWTVGLRSLNRIGLGRRVSEREQERGDEHQVTPLELFFDLAFRVRDDPGHLADARSSAPAVSNQSRRSMRGDRTGLETSGAKRAGQVDEEGA